MFYGTWKINQDRVIYKIGSSLTPCQFHLLHVLSASAAMSPLPTELLRHCSIGFDTYLRLRLVPGCVLEKVRIEGPGPEVIKLFSCSAQPSLKFILLINVKMPTIVGILTFISRINY